MTHLSFIYNCISQDWFNREKNNWLKRTEIQFNRGFIAFEFDFYFPFYRMNFLSGVRESLVTKKERLISITI